MKEKELFERLLLSNMMSKNSSLVFTIEQWELVRRLKNSGITKEQMCQAFDDLDKMEKDLGYSMFGQASNSHKSSSSSSSDDTNKGTTSANSAETSASTATQLINTYFANTLHPAEEAKHIEEFKKKGEAAIQSEISFFVYKHDLKQSQISKMAGVNQAYVSKFLRGEFFEMSENGKALIYKWFLRFLKNPTIYLQAHNITLTTSQNTKNLENSLKFIKNDSFTLPPSFANVTNTSYVGDVTKRTSFRFKPEHLEVLERAFIQNQYPDQKKREELAHQCNLARDCPEREKVREEVITHWFQNKRKSLLTLDVQPNSRTSQREHSIVNNSNSNNNNNHDDMSNNFEYPDFIDDAY